MDGIAGGTAAENAAFIEQTLAGEKGPRRDTVVLNAAFAAMAAGKADTIETGVALASESIDSGRASEKLGALRQTSNELAAAREKE